MEYLKVILTASHIWENRYPVPLLPQHKHLLQQPCTVVRHTEGRIWALPWAGQVLLANRCCYCIIFMSYGSYKITNSFVWEGEINHPIFRVKLSWEKGVIYIHLFPLELGGIPFRSHVCFESGFCLVQFFRVPNLFSLSTGRTFWGSVREWRSPLCKVKPAAVLCSVLRPPPRPAASALLYASEQRLSPAAFCLSSQSVLIAWQHAGASNLRNHFLFSSCHVCTHPERWQNDSWVDRLLRGFSSPSGLCAADGLFAAEAWLFFKWLFRVVSRNTAFLFLSERRLHYMPPKTSARSIVKGMVFSSASR